MKDYETCRKCEYRCSCCKQHFEPVIGRCQSCENNYDEFKPARHIKFCPKTGVSITDMK